MARTRLSTTVDAALLDGARQLRAGSSDAVLIDEACHYRLLTYYVTPREQLRQLQQHGFEKTRLFDHRHGQETPASDPQLADSVHVHYLTRKPLIVTGA